MIRWLPALLALGAAAVPAAAQPGPGGPPAVGVATVRPESITETDRFVGRVQSPNRVDLIARVTGFLEKRLYVEGSEVKAGDLLLQIEKPPFEADVQAKTAAVAQVNAQLQNASVTLGRANALLNTPAGQRSTVDDATASQRSQAAQLLAAQAQLQVAQINLGYTDITAPINGKIGRAVVTVGNVVGPSSGVLATIVSQDPMYVYFPVSVHAALDLRDRYADRGGVAAVVVKLVLPNGKTYAPDGHIDYIDPTVAANTDTLNIRAVIANPVRAGMKSGQPGDRELSDGEFVSVLVQGVTPVQTLAIPQTAILSDQQGNYVWVVGEANKAMQRRVTLGPVSGTLVTVLKGLENGETVVVDGVQRVRPGQPVNPAPAAPGPGGAGGPPGGVAPASGTSGVTASPAPASAPAPAPGAGNRPASGSGTAPSAASPQTGPQGGAGQGRN